MLLRRLTEHVKGQNWTAVGLDFLIVVIGVFIGIQVSNWNAAMGDERRAEELRGRLRADFELLTADLEQNAQRVDRFAKAGQEVYKILLDGDPPAEEARFHDLINAAGSSQPAAGGSPTYAEMLSTGDVRLLKDNELRRHLVEYHQQAELSQETAAIFLPRLIEAIEELDPYIIRGEIDRETGFPEIRRLEFDALAERSALFHGQARLNQNLADLYERQRQLAEQVLARLEAPPKPDE